MLTNLEYREREKKNVVSRPAKERQRARARDKKNKTKETFFVGKTT